MKYGREPVLSEVSLLNVPGSVVSPTEKCFALPIPVTVNVPLNPEFPAPVVLTVLLTFTISTLEPAERLCGSSVSTLTTELPSQFAPATNLKFLCWLTFEIEPLPN